jgi:2-polyprenyl-3-methyl-5-hydroxy-6-metoxy-1,4-benzoquinol methylase
MFGMSKVDTHPIAHERQRLDAIAADSWYAKGASAAMVAHSSRVFSRYFRGTRCLELGPAEGLMTEHLYEHFAELTLVEGAESFARVLRKRYSRAQVYCSLFEEFSPAEKFETIVLGHVLEHLDEPTSLLARASEWLVDDGVILAAVPNARSLHRQAAVIMGLLNEEHELNDMDRHHGHRRVYDPESLRADFQRAGLNIDIFGGYWMKPLSNAQIEASWTPEMLEAFMVLGERYPDIAGEIYVVATRRA